MPKYKLTYTFELETASSLEYVEDDWKTRLDHFAHPDNPADWQSDIIVEDVTPNPTFKHGTIVSGVTSDHSGWVRTGWDWRSIDTGQESTLTDEEIQEAIDNGLRVILFPGVEH